MSRFIISFLVPMRMFPGGTSGKSAANRSARALMHCGGTAVTKNTSAIRQRPRTNFCAPGSIGCARTKSGEEKYCSLSSVISPCSPQTFILFMSSSGLSPYFSFNSFSA